MLWCWISGVGFDATHNFVCVTEYFWAVPTQGFATSKSEDIRRREGCIPEAEAVVQIKDWMSLCLHDHDATRCRKFGAQPGSYPSRLVELGPSSFRVLRTTVDNPRGPYATLSYCWGPNPAFLRLTAGNEKELEAGVSTSCLPLAFREAISVTQKLLIPYIWIDCLCIIQSGPGSAEDWARESSRMHQIYADSVLTLALTCAASPHESILNQARTRRTAMPPFEIKVDRDHRDPGDDAFAVVPLNYFNHAVYEQPLGYRAWTLQERVMATRVVSFGLGELFWDCAQLPNASESIPGGLQATQIEANGPGFFDPVMENSPIFFNLTKKTVPDGSNNEALLETWWSLVHEYTKRELTYPKTDKLVALSAIAHDIGKAMGDVYIAGHFWNTLPESLNWVLMNSPPSRSDPEKAQRLFWSEKPGAEDDRRTPSWSWASMDGPVFGCRGSLPLPQLADAVSYALELANDANPTGACTSASISIRAYCTEIEWESQNEPIMLARTEAWVDENSIFDLDLDETEVIRVEGSKSLMVALSENEEQQEWSGLVVEGIPHEGRIVYRRIGHFNISGSGIEGPTWWDERISIFGEEKRLLELV